MEFRIENTLVATCIYLDLKQRLFLDEILFAFHNSVSAEPSPLGFSLYIGAV